MKTDYTREQAEQVLKDWFNFKDQRETTTKTYEKFLNHKFPSLEAGKWYMHLDNLLFYVREIIENKCYGYGFWDGEWFNNDKIIHYINHGIEDMRQATDKEVEEALIAEAKRRGFKKGVMFIPLFRGGRNYSDSYQLSGDFSYDNEEKSLDVDYKFRIFAHGKWAEIISEPLEVTLEEVAEKFNVSVDQIKIKK